ncbi:MAG: AI-2E family transporter, partial [Rhodobacterales bacterium]|nr:AI-2E family transporter [Rhodobacterales bacterium]
TEWRLKVGAIMDSSAREKTLDSISIIADRLRRYLLARVVLGIITAARYAGWVWIFGIDLLVVWALIVFLLGFIPTFGSLIAGILPVIYAFVQKDFTTAMGAGIGLLVIEQVMGNYVDPRVQGR